MDKDDIAFLKGIFFLFTGIIVVLFVCILFVGLVAQYVSYKWPVPKVYQINAPQIEKIISKEVQE